MLLCLKFLRPQLPRCVPGRLPPTSTTRGRRGFWAKAELTFDIYKLEISAPLEQEANSHRLLRKTRCGSSPQSTLTRPQFVSYMTYLYTTNYLSQWVLDLFHRIAITFAKLGEANAMATRALIDASIEPRRIAQSPTCATCDKAKGERDGTSVRGGVGIAIALRNKQPKGFHRTDECAN